MTAAPTDTIQLIAGLVAHMRQIVGEGAAYAMLHYGAQEEGKRFGANATSADLDRLVDRVDTLLGHQTEITNDDGENVRLEIHGSEFLAAGHKPLQGIVLGLFEGILTASRHARYKGSLIVSEDRSDLTIELKREA